jgi:hypothetical protein
MSTSSSYLNRDRWLWWIGVPICTLLIQHIGISWEEIKIYVTQRSYWYNLTYNVSIITLSLWLLKRWINYLDQRLPYQTNFIRRILFQLSISVVGLMSLIELLTFLYVKVWMQADYWDSHWNTDIIFSISLIILLNLVYLCLYLMHRADTKLDSEEEQEETAILSPPMRLSVQLGNATVSLLPNEIALIVSTNRLVKVITMEPKSYWSNQSLKQLVEQLDAKQFYRANRQILIHRQLIKGYRKLPNRKLELLLTQASIFDEAIHISKEKAVAFQQWLEQSVSLNP